MSKPKKKPYKKPVKKTAKKQSDKTVWQMVQPKLVAKKDIVTKRLSAFKKRRPHRSFRLTKRRDYKRSFKLPGYWAFTNHVRDILWKNRKLFGGLILVYIAATIIIGGFGAQQSYSNLATELRESSGDLFTGNFGAVAEAGVLLTASITRGLSPSLTEGQSIMGGLTFFFVWLASVWLLRNVLAGNKPKLRDGLYNSGSPVLATVLIGFIIIVQLIPAAVALLVLDSAQVSGLMSNGVAAMLVWFGVIVFCLASLYWLISSLIALVIVTLPGMYPWAAIRAAGDLVVGRRLRVLLRLLWLFLVVALVWLVLVIPVILFDDWIKTIAPSIDWFPLVPLVIFSLTAVTVVFSNSYLYLLYRRIVDDDAPPA